MAAPRGDLRIGDTVWLVPRTLGAPAICYGQHQARVAEVNHPYLVVTVDGQRHRVHLDNVRRSDPWRQQTPAPKANTRPALKDCEELPLW